MSVLKGEGKVEILFGSTSIAVASRVHGGYLARPDRSGEWPTIVLVASARGATSSVKDLCRRIARRGFAVVAPDFYRGKLPGRDMGRDQAEAAAAAIPPRQVDRDVGDIVSFITNPAGFWSSAESGFGLVGIGTGGAVAIRAAVTHGAAALALCYPPLASDDLSRLAGYRSPALAMYGRADDVVPSDAASTVREAAPQVELVVYTDAGHDFLDDHDDTYDEGVAADAVERLTAFFAEHLAEATG